MNRKKDIYNIPDIPLKEIIQYFSEQQIDIKNSDILQPNSNTTIRIYESILELFMGIKTIEMLQNQNIYNESVYPLVIFNRMSIFMKKIGISNFSYKDLFFPETKKLISHLSAILNFSLFKDNKMEVYDQIKNTYLEKEELKNEIENNIKIGENRIKELENRILENKKVNENYEVEIKNLENEIKEIYRIQRDKMDKLNEYKIEKQHLQDKISSEQLIGINLKDEITRLKTQIVSDPDKMRDLLNEMKIIVSKEKEALKRFEEDSRNKKILIENGELNKENLKRAIKLALQINDEKKKISAVSGEIEILDSYLSTSVTYIDGQKRRIENIERQISHIEYKINNLNENDKKVSEVICSQMEFLKSDYNKISEKRNNQKKKLETNMKNIKDLESKIIQEENDFNSYICKLQGEISDFSEFIFEYFNELSVFFK